MNNLAILLIALLVIGLLIVGPWFSIMAVNYLFGTSIQLTFWTWLAAFWLHLVVAGSNSSRN
jgi:hypothetical protein